MNDNSTPAAATTTAALFPDGAAIEQISGRRLLLWRDGKSQIGPGCSHLGPTYSPELIDSALEAALQLSDGTVEVQPTVELVAELSATLRNLGNLDASSARLLASFVLATWIPEVLPTTPLLNLYGPRGAEFSLLQILTALVRRPLHLAECSLSELGRLPDSLHPTLILRRPKPQMLEKLFETAVANNVRLLSRGRLLSLRYPAVICSTSAVDGPALCLSVPPLAAQGDIVGDAEETALRNKFLPRLLAYRLNYHRVVAAAQFHISGLTPTTAPVARILGVAVAPAPQFLQQLATDLRALDDAVKTENSTRPAASVLEALLAQVHENRSATTVRQTTELVNAISLRRDDCVELSSKKVGLILRQDLGLIAQRKGAGYKLQLDRATRARIHQLGVDWAVLSLQTPRPGCSFCQEYLPATDSAPPAPSESGGTDPQPTGNVPEALVIDPDHVHIVHDVHDVQKQAATNPTNGSELPPTSDLIDAVEPESPEVQAAHASNYVHDVHDVHVPAEPEPEAEPISENDLLAALEMESPRETSHDSTAAVLDNASGLQIDPDPTAEIEASDIGTTSGREPFQTEPDTAGLSDNREPSRVPGLGAADDTEADDSAATTDFDEFADDSEDADDFAETPEQDDAWQEVL